MQTKQPYSKELDPKKHIPTKKQLEKVDWKKIAQLMTEDMLAYSKRAEKANHVSLSEAQHQILR